MYGILEELVMDKKYLFLDDIRQPVEAYIYTRQEMFLKERWEVVRNFDMLKQWIYENGLPDFISFDHDLAPEHYTPERYWGDYEESRKYQETQNYKEETGYECALWLIDYCTEKSLQLPKFYCHSMNPVGKDKIVLVLSQFAELAIEKEQISRLVN